MIYMKRLVQCLVPSNCLINISCYYFYQGFLRFLLSNENLMKAVDSFPLKDARYVQSHTHTVRIPYWIQYSWTLQHSVILSLPSWQGNQIPFVFLFLANHFTLFQLALAFAFTFALQGLFVYSSQATPHPHVLCFALHLAQQGGQNWVALLSSSYFLISVPIDIFSSLILPLVSCLQGLDIWDLGYKSEL